MTALLTVDDLHVSYGKVEAVTGVSLKMQAGQKQMQRALPAPAHGRRLKRLHITIRRLRRVGP